MNLKMPSLISNDLRILRFMGAMRVFVRGNPILALPPPAGCGHPAARSVPQEIGWRICGKKLAANASSPL